MATVTAAIFVVLALQVRRSWLSFGDPSVVTGYTLFGLLIALALLAALVAGARPRALMRPALAALVVLAAHFLWRHGYYGEWLPNTARVKTGLSGARLERGANYLASLVLAMPALASTFCRRSPIGRLLGHVDASPGSLTGGESSPGSTSPSTRCGAAAMASSVPAPPMTGAERKGTVGASGSAAGSLIAPQK